MVPVNYAGLQLRNPVIVASATPSINVEAIKRAADAGAGAVVTKSMIFPDPETEGRQETAFALVLWFIIPHMVLTRLCLKGMGSFHFLEMLRYILPQMRWDVCWKS